MKPKNCLICGNEVELLYQEPDPYRDTEGCISYGIECTTCDFMIAVTTYGDDKGELMVKKWNELTKKQIERFKK
jgi:hypothetical protein